MNTGIQGPTLRPDGYWVARVEAGYKPNGERNRPAVVGRDRDDVVRRAREMLRKLRTDGPQSFVGRTLTVKTWSKQWLEGPVAKLRPKTQSNYRMYVRRWFVPLIGRRKLGSLTVADVEKVMDAILAKGHSVSYANGSLRAMRTMLREARRQGIYVPDAPLMAKPVETERSDRQAMTLAQIGAVWRVLEKRKNRSRWLFAMLYAPRKGEGGGLTWDRINFEEGTIRVDRQLQQVRYRDRTAGTFDYPKGKENQYIRLDGNLHLAPVKTSTREAVLPLIPLLRMELLEWRKIVPPSPHRLVWPMDDGRPMRLKNDLDEWYAIQEEAGVWHPSGTRRFYEHELKHTAATLLEHLKVPKAARRAILGHATEASSRPYIHPIAEDTTAALEGMSQLILAAAKLKDGDATLDDTPKQIPNI